MAHSETANIQSETSRAQRTPLWSDYEGYAADRLIRAGRVHREQCILFFLRPARGIKADADNGSGRSSARKGGVKSLMATLRPTTSTSGLSPAEKATSFWALLPLSNTSRSGSYRKSGRTSAWMLTQRAFASVFGSLVGHKYLSRDGAPAGTGIPADIHCRALAGLQQAS